MRTGYHTAACHGKPGCSCLSDHREWEAECETPSSWEQIAYWGCVAFACLCTFAMVIGCAGYLYAKFFN